MTENCEVGMTQNSDLDFILKVALNGAEFKQSERRLFLGELRERVLKVLDIAQARSDFVYPEFLQAINDPRQITCLFTIAFQ
ncbi:hypothetical protein N752_10565 [Desulforamulus aquiferis]|nr:DUF1694 domain-containing protein [Desulforamulus aquiferis]RYD05229.1 hypothetical protein N752_10565 [Desulforamulus aquiferis]